MKEHLDLWQQNCRRRFSIGQDNSKCFPLISKTGIVPQSLEFFPLVAKSWLLCQMLCLFRFPVFALAAAFWFLLQMLCLFGFRYLLLARCPAVCCGAC